MMDARTARTKANQVIDYAADCLVTLIDKEIFKAVDNGHFECTYTLTPQHSSERIINRAIEKMVALKYTVQHNADNGTIYLNWEREQQ